MTRVVQMTEPPKVESAGAACLVVIVGSKIGLQIHLDRPVVMGRDPSCDIHFDSDLISRQHARVESFAGYYQLQDLGSTNGTFVNDVKVQHHRLRDGDRVGVGKVLLKFLDGDNIEAEYHKEIYDLMTVDGLTGVANKKHFHDYLATELSRPGVSLASLIIFDADHFKRINDTHGHAAGDAVLRQLAQVVRQVVPGGHLVGRVGGEEFAVALVGVDFPTAYQVAEAVRVAVEQHTFHFEQRRLPVTVSVGLATREVAVEGAEALFKRADEALYRAKQGGRNRVCY
ncbi:MAG: GGDEF domain-containing protein [Polyangiaceae bacterium]|nr:GGDEF domain-containing protein [Polyangiaceae bacterium]MCW5791089.1 GGDEF domain-containing protein [Polyangiaceae bacterium]